MNIKKIPPSEPLEPEYTLTLTRAEMLALISISGHISGPISSPREVFHELNAKAKSIGLPNYKLALRELEHVVSGFIRFEMEV